jgi:hypothetical protein
LKTGTNKSAPKPTPNTRRPLGAIGSDVKIGAITCLSAASLQSSISVSIMSSDLQEKQEIQ